MEIKTLVETYPLLYHMAAGGSWESILRHGLLSTSALLDLFEYKGAERTAIEADHRPEIIEIAHEVHGIAQIRDQKPMSTNGLVRALREYTPEEWYRILNGKVFFWLTEERLLRMLNAAAYRDVEHDVIVVDTASLVDAHSKNITLCPMNSGCTKPYPHARGKETFQTIEDYPFDRFRAKRGSAQKAVVELAVEQSVPDIKEYVVSVRRMNQSNVLETIYLP